MRRCLLETPGVGEVHDLHLWSLGGETPLLTAHLVLDHSVPGRRRCCAQATETRCASDSGSPTRTLQIEPPDYNIVQELTSDAASSD